MSSYFFVFLAILCCILTFFYYALSANIYYFLNGASFKTKILSAIAIVITIVVVRLLGSLHKSLFYINEVVYTFVIFCFYLLCFLIVFRIASYFYTSEFYLLIASVCSLIIIGYGVYNFNQIDVNEIKIYSPKITKEYRLIHLSDLQYGTTNDNDLKRIELLIDELTQKHDVEAILFTGDFVDTAMFSENDFKTLFSLTSSLYEKLDASSNIIDVKQIDLKKLEQFNTKKNLLTFYSYGNHDFIHDEEHITSILQKNSSYFVLRNNNKIYKELNLIGIDDSNSSEQIKRVLTNKKELVVQDKFNILLYHRPTGVLDAKNSNIDLMLSGHTHAGQIFPFSMLISRLFDYKVGLFTSDNFNLYHSSGVSLWGPKLRIGTRNEITIITLLPVK